MRKIWFELIQSLLIYVRMTQHVPCGLFSSHNLSIYLSINFFVGAAAISAALAT